MDLGVFIKGWIQLQLQAHTATLGPSCPGSPCLPSSGPGLGLGWTPRIGRQGEARRSPGAGGWRSGVEDTWGWPGMAPHTQLRKVTGCRGTLLQPWPLQLVPPMDQCGAALLWGVLSAPPAPSSRSSQLSSGQLLGPLPGLPPPFRAFLPTLHSWKRLSPLPNIPFSLYIRQNPGFVLEAGGASCLDKMQTPQAWLPCGCSRDSVLAMRM